VPLGVLIPAVVAVVVVTMTVEPATSANVVAFVVGAAPARLASLNRFDVRVPENEQVLERGQRVARDTVRLTGSSENLIDRDPMFGDRQVDIHPETGKDNVDSGKIHDVYLSSVASSECTQRTLAWRRRLVAPVKP